MRMSILRHCIWDINIFAQNVVVRYLHSRDYDSLVEGVFRLLMRLKSTTIVLHQSRLFHIRVMHLHIRCFVELGQQTYCYIYFALVARPVLFSSSNPEKFTVRLTTRRSAILVGSQIFLLVKIIRESNSTIFACSVDGGCPWHEDSGRSLKLELNHYVEITK